VPVWHEITKPWRESGQLVVLGIAQEQHPERCTLFADWQDLDWPILWDPFHLTGSPAVPNVFALDEQGIVRAVGPSPEWLRDEFLDHDFEPDAAAPVPTWPVSPGEDDALGRILFAADGVARDALLDEAIEELQRTVAAHPGDGAALFRLGVALRMRFDGGGRRAADFQTALDAWAAALATDPNVYIWRRRIQQYGPRMDKPYPFYSWVQEAATALRERGTDPPAWVASGQLTAAELAQPRRELQPATEDETPPDPEGAIHRVEEGFEVATAAAWDSSGARSGRLPLARVHLDLRPVPGSGQHWNNEAGPLQVWLGHPELPEGWVVERRLLSVEGAPDAEVSDEPRRLEFEVRLPHGAEGSGQLTGYALFNTCSDEDGTCVFRRLDFTVELDPPTG
jgi:hypothetical protein